MSGYGAFNLGCPLSHRRVHLTRPTKLIVIAVVIMIEAKLDHDDDHGDDHDLG